MSDRRVRVLGLLFVAGVGCTLTPPDRSETRNPPSPHDQEGLDDGRNRQ
jgi:hypothetical protein